MALAAGRADAGILGAGKDQPVSWDVPAVIDCLSCPRAGPPVAGSSPLGPATPASILFALRI
jgi:hypothetical protein